MPQWRTWGPRVFNNLLLGDIHRGASPLPFDTHGATRSSLIKSNREVLHRRRKRGNFHVHAREVEFRPGIFSTPLTGFFADDQCPLIRVGHGEECVAAGGNFSASDVDVRSGDKRRGFVSSESPDFSIRNESPKDFAALGARAGIV